MDDHAPGKSDIEQQDVFSLVNNYFLLFFCASCMISSMYVQQLFFVMNQYRAGIGVSAALGIILPVYLLTRRFGTGFRAQLRMVPPRAPQAIYLILATLCVVAIVDQIYLITQQFMPVPTYYTDSLQDIKPTGGWTFALTFAGLCVLVPFAEELVFRGFVQQIFSRNMGGVAGFLLAGILFGASHLNAHLLISIAFFGVFLGFVYYATGNLTYTIISHSLFNAVALLQLTFSGSRQEESSIPFYLRDDRILVIALVLLVYFLYKLKQAGPETRPPWEPPEEKEEKGDA